MRITDTINQGHRKAVTDSNVTLDLYRCADYRDGLRVLVWEARDTVDGALVAKADTLRGLRVRVRLAESATV